MSTKVEFLKLDGNLILWETFMELWETKTEINNQDGVEEFSKLITMISETGNLMKNNQTHTLLNHQECLDTEMICIYSVELTQVDILKIINFGNIFFLIGYIT